MSFQQTFQKINSSEVFGNFIKKYPNAELCAGFFILDFISNDSKKALDYKTDDKIFTFDLGGNGKIIMNEDRLIEDNKFPELKKISPEIKIELDELKSIAGIRTLDEGIRAKFNKIIAILQMHEGEQIWNLTCMLEGLIILNILIDAGTGNILKFEKKSMADLIKKQK